MMFLRELLNQLPGAIYRLDRLYLRRGSSIASVSEPISELCATCTTIDVGQILRDGLLEKDMVPLGLLPEIEKKARNCALCRLVSSHIRHCWRLDDNPNLDLGSVVCRMHAIGYGPRNFRLDTKERCHRLLVKISGRPLTVTQSLMAAEAQLHVDIQLLEEDSHKVSRVTDYHGRRLKDTVDINLIMKWIHFCKTEHGDQCESVWWTANDDDPPDFVRMIDVKQMALVRAPPRCRYVALSYVWGGGGEEYWTTMSNVTTRNRPAGLDKSVLPATILDAIDLVKRVRERYLWIDALCIVQDSRTDKVNQIRNMDLIYSRATFTVFAADGDSARAGLSGLTTGTRTCKQHVETVQGLHLVLPLPSSLEAAAESTWNTRGWTFQELLLSRRRLFFTKYQVYFECAEDSWCEDVSETKSRHYDFSMPTTVNTGVFLPSSRITPAFNIDTYASAIRRYSRRLLTYESDIVAAITAFINVLTIRCEPPGTDARAAFPYGMWVKYLDYTLLWQPRLDTSQSRRLVCESEHSRWPSWAWAGWKGGVDYTDETTLVGSTWSYSTHGSPVESLVATWHVVKEDRELVRLDVERFLPSWNAEDMGRERYSRCGSHQSDLEMAFLPPPGTLVFRTQRTHFQVVKMDGRPQDKTFTIFDVFAPQSESKGHVGRIILPVETSSLAVLEFIVISRSGGSRGLHDELSWGDVYYGCMLHVMAVRQSFSDIRLRERLGVGLVIESAWLKSAAEEAVILLA